jgi:hypothetical protein
MKKIKIKWTTAANINTKNYKGYGKQARKYFTSITYQYKERNMEVPVANQCCVIGNNGRRS